MAEDKETLVTVYVIIFPNGMIYVGQTTNTLAERLWEHVRHAFREGDGAHNSVKYKAVRDWCNVAPIIIKPLQEGVPYDQRIDVEREWIWKLHSNDPAIGYNFADGREVTDVRAYQRAWCAANPEKVRAKQAKWRTANPEKNRAHCRAWRRANKDKCNAYQRAYRAAKKAAKLAAEGQMRVDNFNTDNN